jgi:ATP-dependent helicase/nuclease subunit A
MANNLRLPFDGAAGQPPRRPPRDHAARRAAVDPEQNVVLEASAGTGKTRVLVDRYVGLLAVGVLPANILAMTFTRKAAAEMRSRIIATLREQAQLSPEGAARWTQLRDHLNEIAISTIDAFCLSLLREFPLEADLDPGFDVADETAIPRLVAESLDRTLRACRTIARDDEDVALLFAQLGETRLRKGLSTLLGNRLVAGAVLDRVLSRGPSNLTVADACREGATRLAGVFESMPGGLDTFLASGPAGHPAFDMLAGGIRAIVGSVRPGAEPYPPHALRGLLNQLQEYFFTKAGTPRVKMPPEFKPFHQSAATAKAHWATVNGSAPTIEEAGRGLRRDLNVILSRAVRRVFQVAIGHYRRTLDRHGVLDFAELLVRARDLLGNMDEFARSRYLLEARYHHVLVDEFQDTSRAQWDLVSQLVRAWGEGFGPAHGAIPPSIFIVGDRKQSIYGFRNAEVALLDEAARMIAGLRPDSEPIHTITHSFRSMPAILAFVNDVCAGIDKRPDRTDAFRYDDRDRFPLDDDSGGGPDEPAIGVAVGPTPDVCAQVVAAEIERLLAGTVVRDRDTGVRRQAEPGDIAILFRTRAVHRLFEAALDTRRIPTYVYKGLGFFDADEIKDILALIRYLADPESDIRAAAFLRSRLVRLSDPALQVLAPRVAAALIRPVPPDVFARLDEEDQRVLTAARESAASWLRRADLVPPAELIDAVLDDVAFAFEWRDARLAQARENVKKIRSLVRRIQNRGYLTLGRLADHLARLSGGDESNAVVDALNAVNLMTVHAAKGLEFPIVFVVSFERGTGGFGDPIRVSAQEDVDDAVAIGDFQSSADEDAPDRDAEETKRLLYVALTRGRDRLYISAATKNGTLAARPGSLGAVCPAEVRDLFSQAGAAAGREATVTWPGPSGHRHTIVVCAPVADELRVTAVSAAEPTRPAWSGTDGASDFAPLATGSDVERLAVTALPAARHTRAARKAAGDSDRLIAGRLVHRLFQFGAPDEEAPEALRSRAARLLTDDERHSAGDPDAVIDSAIDLFVRLRQRDDVRAILDHSVCLYEVPFTTTLGLAAAANQEPTPDEPAVVRGVIDCLAIPESGPVVVLDFKTGHERPSDTAQLRIYEAAVRTLLPDRDVAGRLVYGQAQP